MKTCDICYEDADNIIGCNTCTHGQCRTCSIRLEKCPFCRTNFYTEKQKYKIKQLKRYMYKFVKMYRHTEHKERKMLAKDLCKTVVRYKDIFSLPIFDELRTTIHEFIKENKSDIPFYCYLMYSIFK